MPKTAKDLLEFWEDQMKLSHMSSNYFFRKSPSHYHMMLLVMHAFKYEEHLTVEELKTKLFKTSRPKSALMINEACEKGFFFLEKASDDQRKKFIKPSKSFIDEFGQGTTFPQVVVDGKKLGGCVDTIEFLRENQIAK